MKYLHKSLSNLPIIIVINWMICAFFLTKNEFYIHNFELLDKIDTFIVYFSLMHFMFFNKWYSFCKKTFCSTIILCIILNFCYNYINADLYFYLYLALILAPFTVNLWKQSAKK